MQSAAPVHLKQVKTKRFYSLRVVQDLFGQISVERNFGGLLTSIVHTQWDYFDDVEAANQSLYKTVERKVRGGYQVVD